MYTVDYFIAKFNNTRDDKWIVGTLHGSNNESCANGWCGVLNDYKDGKTYWYTTSESIGLQNVFSVLSIYHNRHTLGTPLY